MKQLLLKLHKFRTKTLVKYLVSYLLIFTILISGFFFITKKQLEHGYYQRLCVSAQQNLAHYTEQLNDSILYLYQVDKSLVSNTDIISSRYKEEGWSNYQAMTELVKYDLSSELIDSVIYMPYQTEEVLSTKLTVNYSDGVFYFVFGTPGTLSFAPASYMNTSGNQLIFLTNNQQQLLLYLPAHTSISKYIRFYSIDTEKICQQMRGLFSDEMLSLALISPDKQIVTGINTEQLSPYLDTLTIADGIYTDRNSNTLCVATGISGNFTLVSLLSNDFLVNQINRAFTTAYLSLFLLSLVGFLLIFIAMKLTYAPLHRFTSKIAGNHTSGKGDLERLEQSFLETRNLNKQFQDKLESYRVFMQKSLFESNLMVDNSMASDDLITLDHFFSNNSHSEIFAICLQAPNNKVLPHLELQEYFNEILPIDSSCYLLENHQSYVIYLLNYVGSEPNKKDTLIETLTSLYEERGYISAISNGSFSPLDIPILRKNVMQAYEQGSSFGVTDYELLSDNTKTIVSYPHKELQLFSTALVSYEYAEAAKLTEQLFNLIDHAEDSVGISYSVFYQKSILVDMLTIIANTFIQANIKFKNYNDLYFDTLFNCRSNSYKEKAAEIKANIHELLTLYEHEVTNQLINKATLSIYLEEHFAISEFSINMLADHFNVSIAYMSFLFKKEMGQNFADYLWKLRLDKATHLLSTSDLSIDAISIAVGYLNTSSFRRRFKQEVGYTPSEYRQVHSVGSTTSDE